MLCRKEYPSMEEVKKKLTDEELAQVLTSGGDERIELNAEGLNKYHINPLKYQGVFNRASCTCSPLNTESHEHLNSFQNEVAVHGFEIVKERQKQRIKRLIRTSENVEIAFAPSGSDLCYYPLLFRKLISPDKPILNLLTCPEELGSGSVTANQGRFYGVKNQLNDELTKGEQIDPNLDIELMSFSARDEEGKIIDHRDKIAETIAKYKDKYALIGNIVIGSKSGISDNLTVVREFQDDILWVVDLCQLRANTHIVRKLLNLNCLIMITGSKFYQSPPFSGALIIPESISKRVRETSSENPWGMNRVFTKTDLPACADHIGHHFSDYQNRGLMYRWETALFEMEKLSKFSEKRVTDIIDEWNKTLVNRIKESEYFELMKDQSRTNSSIISLKVKINGEFLKLEEMTKLYRDICNTPTSGALEDFKKVIIGQPVSYPHHTFIRLALGSYNIRKLVENNLNFELDLALVDHIEQIIEEKWA